MRGKETEKERDGKRKSLKEGKRLKERKKLERKLLRKQGIDRGR